MLWVLVTALWFYVMLLPNPPSASSGSESSPIGRLLGATLLYGWVGAFGILPAAALFHIAAEVTAVRKIAEGFGLGSTASRS